MRFRGEANALRSFEGGVIKGVKVIEFYYAKSESERDE